MTAAEPEVLLPDIVFQQTNLFVDTGGSDLQNTNLLVSSADKVVQLSAPVEVQGDRVLASGHVHQGRRHWEQTPVGCEVIYAQSGTHDQQLQGLH